MDANGNMIFDMGGWVTRRKKPFKQKAECFKAAKEVLLWENPTLVPAYIEESNSERDNRTVLCVKAGILTPLAEIDRYFSQAGEIKSIMISRDVIQRELSAEIEFYSYESVAVAVALAVKDRWTNICTKTNNIRVDSYRFPIKENVMDRAGNWREKDVFMDIFTQKIHIGFSHIPMTVDWLEKIFRVFGVVEMISLPRPINHFHLGHAVLQFESINAVHDALRLNGQLKLSYKDVEVKTEVSALDGTTWLHDGTLNIVCVAPKEDDGSL